MERRVALKQLATLAGGLVTLPARASGWTAETVHHQPGWLSVAENDLLALVTDTIIPPTDIPGATALEVHMFVERMIADCYEKPAQEAFRAGLSGIEAMIQQQYGKSYRQCGIPQRLSVLMQFQASPKAAEKEFFATLKSLTIQGYITSEYVMTRHLNYVMAPGHYYGCVPAGPKTISERQK